MARKSAMAKLHDSRNMPLIQELSDPKEIARLGGPRMLIAPPLAYDRVMRQVPYGMVMTADTLRDHLAREHGADFTCPLTAGIFINIVAQASAERCVDPTPYWRTLRRNGELNEKYPDGIEGHRALLEAEGLRVTQRGKRHFVQDLEQHRYAPE